MVIVARYSDGNYLKTVHHLNLTHYIVVLKSLLPGEIKICPHVHFALLAGDLFGLQLN